MTEDDTMKQKKQKALLQILKREAEGAAPSVGQNRIVLYLPKAWGIKNYTVLSNANCNA